MVKAKKQNHLAPSHHIAQEWGWFMVVGLVLLGLGIIASFILPFAGATAAIYIGLMMVVAGIIQIVHAFGVKDIGRLLYWGLVGFIYVVGGIICLLQPIFAAAIITFLIGLFLIVAGVIRIFVGFKHYEHKGYGWLIAAGFISVIAGILITLGWPENSLWVLGMFVAIDLIIQGWSFLIFSLNLRSNDHQEDAYHEAIDKNSKVMPIKKAAKAMLKNETPAKPFKTKSMANKANVASSAKNMGKKIIDEIDDSFDAVVNTTKKTIDKAGKTANSSLKNASAQVKTTASKVSHDVKNMASKADSEVKKAASKVQTAIKTPSKSPSAAKTATKAKPKSK